MRTKKSEFQLEPLEPRLLLSGEALFGALAAPATILALQTEQAQATITDQTAVTASSQTGLLDLFDTGTAATQTPAAQTPVATETAQVSTQETTISSSGSDSGTGALTSASPSDQQTTAEQLVETLHAANGPPAIQVFYLCLTGASDVTYQGPVTVTGDIELFYVGNQAINVTATGKITATYIKTNGQDVSLTSTGNKIVVDHLDTGSTSGLVTLKALSSVAMDAATVTGETPTLNCGNTLKISTTNTVKSPSSGTNDLELHGIVKTAAHAEFNINGNVLIDAALTAGLTLKVHSNAGSITLKGTYGVGSDCEVLAYGQGTGTQDITINAAMTVANGLHIESTKGAVTMNGTFQSVDYANINSLNKLYFNGSLTVGILVNGKLTSGGGAHLKSQNGIVEAHGSVWAYVEITIDGKPGYLIDAKLSSVTKTVSITTH
jgi:hypothetical protein